MSSSFDLALAGPPIVARAPSRARRSALPEVGLVELRAGRGPPSPLALRSARSARRAPSSRCARRSSCLAPSRERARRVRRCAGQHVLVRARAEHIDRATAPGSSQPRPARGVRARAPIGSPPCCAERAAWAVRETGSRRRWLGRRHSPLIPERRHRRPRAVLEHRTQCVDFGMGSQSAIPSFHADVSIDDRRRSRRAGDLGRRDGALIAVGDQDRPRLRSGPNFACV